MTAKFYGQEEISLMRYTSFTRVSSGTDFGVHLVLGGMSCNPGQMLHNDLQGGLVNRRHPR